jgi:uncharacterized protein
MDGELAWRSVQWPGLEHVLWSAGGQGFRADGLLVMADKSPVRVSYQLHCDAGWTFRGLTITVTGAGSRRSLELSVTGEGGWLAGDRPLPELSGCADIDISCTPLTNTLPIRRLDWSPGASRDLGMAYVSVPELTVRPVRQRYTMLASDPAAFRYESGSFRAELPVDGDGFVLDYPGIWERVAGVKPAAIDS